MERTKIEEQIVAILRALPKEFTDSDNHWNAVVNVRCTIEENPSEFSGDYTDNPDMMAANLDFQFLSGEYEVEANLIEIWKVASKKILKLKGITVFSRAAK